MINKFLRCKLKELKEYVRSLILESPPMSGNGKILRCKCKSYRSSRESERDKKGISPVIGAILLVALTIALISLIASFSFSIGEELKVVPKAQFMLSDAKDELRRDNTKDEVFYLDHLGGDVLACSELVILVYSKETGEIYREFDYNETDHIFYLSWTGLLNKTIGEGVNKYVLNNDLFEPGERIIFKENMLNWKPGTYVVKILHVPSGNFIFVGEVTVR